MVLEDIGLPSKTSTQKLENHYEIALTNLKQLQNFVRVVGKELDRRHA